MVICNTDLFVLFGGLNITMKKILILILFIIPIILVTSCNTNTINKNTLSSSDFEENNTTFSCSKRNIETQNRKIVQPIMFQFINAQNPEELINHSECVITGNVKFISEDVVLYNESKNRLSTIYEVTISEAYKGDYLTGDKLYLTLPYGENDEYILVDNQYPKLENKKDYLLFISKITPDIKGSYEYYQLNLPDQGCIPFDFDINDKKYKKSSITYAFPDCKNYNDIIDVIKVTTLS
jgi:hypothetical protein